MFTKIEVKTTYKGWQVRTWLQCAALCCLFLAGLSVSGMAQRKEEAESSGPSAQTVLAGSQSKVDPRKRNDVYTERRNPAGVDLSQGQKRRLRVDFGLPPVRNVGRLDKNLDGDDRTIGDFLGTVVLLDRGIRFSFDLFNSGRFTPNTPWGDANRAIESGRVNIPERVREPLEYVVWYGLSQNGMVQIFQEFMEGLAGDREMMNQAREDAERAVRLLPNGNDVLYLLNPAGQSGAGDSSSGLPGDGNAPLPGASSSEGGRTSRVVNSPGGGSIFDSRGSGNRRAQGNNQNSGGSTDRNNSSGDGNSSSGGQAGSNTTREPRDSNRGRSSGTSQSQRNNTAGPPAQTPPTTEDDLDDTDGGSGDGGGGDGDAGPADSGAYDGGTGPFGQGVRFLPPDDPARGNGGDSKGGDVGGLNMPGRGRIAVRPYRIEVGERKSKKKSSPDDSEKPQVGNSARGNQGAVRNSDDIGNDLPGNVNGTGGVSMFNGKATDLLRLKKDFRPMPIP